MSEFGIGIDPRNAGGSTPEPAPTGPTESQLKAQEVWEKAPYVVPEDWDVARIDEAIAELRRSNAELRQAAAGMRSQPWSAAAQGNGSFQREWAADFGEMKITALEARKQQLEAQGSDDVAAEETPAIASSTDSGTEEQQESEEAAV